MSRTLARVKTTLVQSAWAAVSVKDSYLRSRFLRIKGRRGLDGDRITNERVYLDVASLVRQIGRADLLALVGVEGFATAQMR